MTVLEQTSRVERIHAAFRRAADEGRAAFIPFMTAGYPDQARFPEVAAELLKRADLMEIGIPF